MPPYLPFIEALGEHIRTQASEQLRVELGGGHSYIARLLPGIRKLLPDLAEPAAIGAELERYRLFEEVAEFVLRIGAGRPLMLFLDDLHWADRGTLLLLQHVARRVGEGQFLIVGTYRDAEVDARHPLTELLVEMTRQKLGSVLTLGPLDRDDTAALIEASLGKPASRQVVDALFRAGEGNPFFTEELVRHLREQGRDLADPEAAVGEWGIPVGVNQVITGRLARLSEDANRVLLCCAILGRDLSPERVAAAAEIDESRVLELFEEALPTHMLREERDGFVFAHPLVRETLYQGLSAPRRQQLHRRVAEALETLYSAEPEAHLDELAHHFFQGGASADAEKTLRFCTGAAERAAAEAAHEEAVRLYEMALGVLAPSDESRRFELMLAQAQAQFRGGQAERERDTAIAVATAAKAADAAEWLARASLLGAQTRLGFGELDRTSVDLLENAITALGDDKDQSLKVQALAALATMFSRSFERELVARAQGLSAEALGTARHLDEPETTIVALRARSEILFFRPEYLEEHLHVAQEIVRVGGGLGDTTSVYEAHDMISCDALMMGDMTLLDAEINELLRLADELRQPALHSNAEGVMFGQALLQGRFREADRLLHRVLTMSEDAGMTEHDVLIVLGQKPVELLPDQERIGEPEQAIKRLIAGEDAAIEFWHARLAHFYAEIDRAPEARAAYEAAASDDFANLPDDGTRFMTTIFLARACATVDDINRAPLLYMEILPFAGTFAANGNTLPMGPTDQYLGILASTMRRWADAEKHFEAALELANKMRAKPFVARTQYDYARMLQSRGGDSDRKKARTLLNAALSTALELGMTRLEANATDLLAEPAIASPAQRSALPDGLTGREVEVLRLIAAGRTNAEIAEDLVLSVRTVERQITNIYRKIGARGKADATAYVLRHDLAPAE
ncbi:MAG: LuxR C-terminal-related transcriptional regulator [Dehalococcoidia bacterium]